MPKVKVKLQDGTVKEYDQSSPEYRALYQSGKLAGQNSATGEFTGRQLPEATVTGKKTEWNKLKEHVIDENKNTGLLGQMTVVPFGMVAGVPQLLATRAITGKYQRPSEALHRKTFVGKLATDMLLDPLAFTGLATAGTKGLIRNAPKIAKAAGSATNILSKVPKVFPYLEQAADNVAQAIRPKPLPVGVTDRATLASERQLFPTRSSYKEATEDLNRHWRVNGSETPDWVPPADASETRSSYLQHQADRANQEVSSFRTPKEFPEYIRSERGLFSTPEDYREAMDRMRNFEKHGVGNRQDLMTDLSTTFENMRQSGGIDWDIDMPSEIFIPPDRPQGLLSRAKQTAQRYTPSAIRNRKNLPPPPPAQEAPLSGWGTENWEPTPPPDPMLGPEYYGESVGKDLFFRPLDNTGSIKGFEVHNPFTGERVYTSQGVDGIYSTYGNMKNQFDAGKGLLTLKKRHTIGDIFGNPGSLSPDSWKLWQTEVNRGNLLPIETGKYTHLNPMGKHSELSKLMSGEMFFSTEAEAEKAAEYLGSFIKHPDIKMRPRVTPAPEGSGMGGTFYVEIPDLLYKKLNMILGAIAGGGVAGTVASKTESRRLGGLLKKK
jgi:hypothetical protein